MSILEKLFVLVQYPLPHHGLSRLIGWLTYCRNPALKNFLIRTIAKVYGVDWSEAAQPDPSAYACFNDFFTRALKPGVRPIVAEPGALAGPADGYMSQLGPITEGRIIQAKGKDYSVADLLGGEAARAEAFMGGSFATIYLSPKDYHRLHMPLAGTLREMVYVPGRLFSVNNATARGVPNLFARNERVVAIFDTEAGPMALILVGAIFVASIETVWHGLVTPPAGQSVQVWNYQDRPVYLERGAEMGRFKMGSTIIVLFGKDAVEWGNFAPGEVMRLGAEVGKVLPR